MYTDYYSKTKNVYIIVAVSKSDRHDLHEKIKAVLVIDETRTSQIMTQQEVINRINNGDLFYADLPLGYYNPRNTHRVKVIVQKSRYGNDYIKTVGDEEKQNNLLSLPDIPYYSSEAISYWQDSVDFMLT